MDIDIDVDLDSYFGCFNGAFKVRSGTVKWYRSSYGTDFDNSEIALPAQEPGDPNEASMAPNGPLMVPSP